MRPHHFHHRLRQALAGIVIYAMLAQAGWSGAPCCCHDQQGPGATDSCASDRLVSACCVDEPSTESCGSSCSHACTSDQETAPTILPSQHHLVPHRCCRDYCQPVSSGGKESCTCEIEPTSLAIVSPTRVNTSTSFFVYWLDSTVDVRKSIFPYDLHRNDASPLSVKSPGRAQSILFERWLI